jgi:hypothetical protein
MERENRIQTIKREIEFTKNRTIKTKKDVKVIQKMVNQNNKKQFDKEMKRLQS